MQTINKLFVRYGEGEYVGHISCQDVAKQYKRHARWPLLVNVYEQAGWWQEFFFDTRCPEGVCVGTANDKAQFEPEIVELRKRIYNAELFNVVGDIRRPKRRDTVERKEI